MNMDRNSLLAIAACVVFFIAYQSYLTAKYPDMGKKQPEGASQENQVESINANKDSNTGTIGNPVQPKPVQKDQKAAETIELLPDEQLRFENRNVIYEFNQEFSAINRVILKEYQEKSDGGTPLQLVNVLDSPMKIQAVTQVERATGDAGYFAERKGSSLLLSKQNDNWRIEQEFTLPEDGYGLEVRFNFTNISSGSLDLNAGLLIQENLLLSESAGFGPASFVTQRKSLIAGVDGDGEHEDAQSVCEDEDVVELENLRFNNAKVDFIGFDKHYFLAVFKPKLDRMSSYVTKLRPTRAGVCAIAMMVYQPMGLIKPGEQVSLGFTGFMGPKDLEILKSHDPVFANTLNFKTLGLDLSFLAKGLLGVIQYFYSLIPNYGIAIILLTFCLKILFYPLTKSAAVSMKKMQKLQPEMNKIKEKFAKDPQKQQQEIMKFLSVNKANPMKGCLPILPQMPVFIAFYSVLSQAIELRHAEFFGWILDLSAKDPYYITPLLLGVLMFLQQKLTPNPGMDPNQQKIMMMMPVIFTVMMLSLPAGLVLYMVVNTVVSIAQQQWLNKKLDNMEFKVARA